MTLSCGHPEVCLKDGECQWCKEVKILRAVEAQLRQRLYFLIDNECKECKRREREAKWKQKHEKGD